MVAPFLAMISGVRMLTAASPHTMIWCMLPLGLVRILAAEIDTRAGHKHHGTADQHGA